MFLVEHTQGRGANVDLVQVLQDCHPLAEEEAAPAFEYRLTQHHLGHRRRNLRNHMAVIQDSSVHMQAVSFFHLLEREKHRRLPDVQGFPNHGRALALLCPPPNLASLVVSHEAILPLGHFFRLADPPSHLGLLLLKKRLELLQLGDSEVANWNRLGGFLF